MLSVKPILTARRALPWRLEAAYSGEVPKVHVQDVGVILLHFYTRPSWAKGKWALRAGVWGSYEDSCRYPGDCSEFNSSTFHSWAWPTYIGGTRGVWLSSQLGWSMAGVANALRWDDHHQASTLCTLWQLVTFTEDLACVHPLDWIVTTLNVRKGELSTVDS